MKISLENVDRKLVEDYCYLCIGAAIEVHKELGPGLLESIYEKAMELELKSQGLKCKSQVNIPVHYKGELLNQNYKLDLIVEDLIVLELKTVSEIIPIHEAQLLTYLKLTGAPKGIIINFNVDNIARNMVSMVSETYKQLPERLT